MMSRTPRGFRRLAVLVPCCLALAACDRPAPPPPAVPRATAESGHLPAPPRDEIPPGQLAAVIDAHYRGLGAMERYEYREAARAFREVHERAPGWTIGTINLAIALLNQGGEAKERAKAGGGDDPEATSNIDAARRLLDAVIAAHPDQPYALFSRGIILASQGEMVQAHRDFSKVAAIDPHDAHTWLEYGMTLTDPEHEGSPAGRKQAPELIAAFDKALAANPYLVTAMYTLSQAYGKASDRVAARRWLELRAKFDPKRQSNAAAAGEVAATVYDEMGKYARIINPFPRPAPPVAPPPAPKFAPVDAANWSLSPGDRWATAADYAGRHAAIGRVRARFGAGVATGDFDRDGRLDVYLTAAVVGPQGLRDALFLNRGDGRFEDRTAAYGLPLDRAGLGVAAGDFDGDLQVDLYLTGINDNRLFRQGLSTFQDVTTIAGVAVPEAVSIAARWFDLDQDGDLDLYVVNHAPVSDVDRLFAAGGTGPGLANVAFRNDGRPAAVGNRPEDNWAPLAAATPDLPTFGGLSVAFSTAWPSAAVLQGGGGRHSAFAALDIDDDRDFDYVLTADDAPAQVLLNDRAGSFRAVPLGGWAVEGPVAGLLVADVDRDGRPDLVATGPTGRVSAWRNETSREGARVEVKGSQYPINARGWRSAVAIDLDLDTWGDLVGLPAAGAGNGVEWARNAGTRFENRSIPPAAIAAEDRMMAGFALADLVGDALPDLLTWHDGEAPRLARNLGNGLNWLAVDLAGRWKTSHDQMRTNSEGLGARLALEGQGLYVPVDYSTREAGAAQSVGPLVLGLGDKKTAPLLRVRWPDGVMQAELNVTANKTLGLVEFSRKTGSCPILFTWNGERFVCVGDFAGAAGLGFLEAPGEYHPPDRDEAMAITPEQLRDVGGTFRLSVVEPMDEVAYLDQMVLDVVDRPPGVTVGLDERFAFGGAAPSGEVIGWSEAIPPVSALDHRGRDVLPLVRAADRRSVDQFDRINGWIGFTEDHALTLDFGDVLGRLKPGDEPVLCLAGWVEYPYSQTNYAAATAGIALKPPTLDQRLEGGGWRVIDPQMGHPAGLTRLMTYSLDGKLVAEPRCVLRLRTNMECYWDQAFIAIRHPDAMREVRTTRLAVAQARLRDRGYLRESSPDGLKPVLPDYDKIDPAPLARLQGELTRHGDVAALLRADDDHLCVMGPGDEVRIEFDGRALSPLPPGWARSFVLRSVAYCKDADPFTATSDSVGPLPWKGMKAFPPLPGDHRPDDPAYAAYLREYQTRPAGAP